MTIGGTGVMVLGALVAGGLAVLLALALRARFGTATSTAVAGLLWSLIAIVLVTLVPTRPDVGVVPAETRSESCSWDYGGPSGTTFEVLGLDQRTLNVLLFVPAGVFLVLAVGRWWSGVVLAPRRPRRCWRRTASASSSPSSSSPASTARATSPTWSTTSSAPGSASAIGAACCSRS